MQGWHGTWGLDSPGDVLLLEHIKCNSCVKLGLMDQTEMQAQLLPLFAYLKVTGDTSWQQEGRLWLCPESIS